MKYRPVFFYSEDDKAYVAVCPGLPGCMADGETIKDALVNLEEASEGWLQVYSELGKTFDEIMTFLSEEAGE